MSKLFKRVMATAMAAVISASALCTSAFASGTVKKSLVSVNNQTDVIYNFDVDGNEYVYNTFGSHNGAKSSESFRITEKGSYTITFGGTQYAGATVRIRKVGSSSSTPYAEISIPKRTTGMPTLSKSVNFETGYYTVEAISDSYSSYSVGSIRINCVYN